jgi:G:T-mismatch repair DNA endonuclease (very short patch repair protein)
MKCPVCGKEDRVRIYCCAKCAVYVHEKFWQKHAAQARKD